MAGAEWRLHLEEGRALFRLAVPIALIALVNMGMSVTDGVMVSLIFGTDALAAVAVGSDLYSIVFYLGAGVLGGLAPFYTAAVTHLDAEEKASLVRVGWMTVCLLAIASVPIVWLAPSWLKGLGLEAALLEQGRGYTQTMALTLVPMLGVMLYRTILTAAEQPKVFLRVTLAMLPLNAVANYLLMTGPGPLPALGPTGAGTSSLLVALMTLAVLVAIARRASNGARPAHSARACFDWLGLIAVIRIGLPIGIATVAEVGIFLGATLYAATLGAADVAAHTLTLRTAGIAYAVPAALLQASMVRMARAESLEDPRHRHSVITSSLGLALLCGTIICLLMVGVAGSLAASFFDESHMGLKAAKLAFGLLILLGLIDLVGGPGSATTGLLRGRKDTRTPMVYMLVGYWLIGAPLGLYLCEVLDFGVTGLWTGLAAGTLTTTLLSLARLFSTSRQHR